MGRSAAALILVSLGVCALAAQQSPQTPPLIFRSEVNYVEVDATVTDAQGNPVNDLSRTDFEVTEDGKPQEIAAFSRVDLPVTRPERPLFLGQAVEPDVRTNEAIEGRIYMIVLDDLHTAFARTPRVKRTVRQFIESAIGVNDIAAVVYTGSNDKAQDFTNDPRLLLAAVDKFTGRKLPSATMNQLNNATVDANTGGVVGGADIDKAERSYRARSVMGSIRKLSEFMANVRGRRKAMLWFGEGIDYDVSQAMGTDGSTASIVLEDIRNAIAAAQRGNVAVYTIDPRGLFNAGDDLIETAGLTDDIGQPASQLQAEVRNAQDSLRQVAVDTGGFSVLNTNEFANAFDRIIRENSSYYLFGYYSTNDKRDGRTRRLRVRVKRAGLTVRARNSYVAPKGKAPAPVPPAATAPAKAVADALGSPLPTSGVPLRVFAAPFKGTAPNAAIAFALEVDASHFDFVNANGTWNDTLEVVNSAVEAGGKAIPGDRTKVGLTLKPETYDLVKANGLRVLGQTELPPGRYQLRFAAGNGTGKAGSVLYDLVVPDFTADPLMLSGVALTSQSQAGDRVATIRPKDPLKDFLPGPPVAVRTFPRGDLITLFGEVYDNVQGQAHLVTITTRLVNDAGRVVRTVSEQRSSKELAAVQGGSAKNGGYGFTAGLSLADVEPGLYVIRVEATGNFGSLPKAAKDILIRVAP